MPRMFLAVPSDPIVPEGNGVTYLPDGLMVDLSADMRCGTCKWWLKDQDQHYCAVLGNHPGPDFGCVQWDPKDE